MTDTEKLEAFVNTETKIGRFTLRPISAGTLVILKLMHNELVEERIMRDPVTNEIVIDPDTNQPKQREIQDAEFHAAAFIFVHAADPKTVRRSASSTETFRQAVLEFADGMNIGEFTAAADAIRSMIQNAMIGQDYEVEQNSTSPPNA